MSPQAIDAAKIWGWRVVILAVVLGAWQWLPEVRGLSSFSPVFNPFFVSSPSRVFQLTVQLMVGSHGEPLVWTPLWTTLKATLLGVVIGTTAGAVLGLLLSNSPRAHRILAPFVTFMNAMPRIALVPIFVIIAGPTLTASIATAVAVVLFITFYNALAGGMSVPQATINNAKLLGASGREVMFHVRMPYVVVWTVVALPNAVAFGLVAVVTAELLTGLDGMGRLLLNSITDVDSTLTFTTVVFLSVAGVILVTGSEFASKRLMHWWETS